MAVHGENAASVRPITDALNANGFNCDTDVASGAFLGLAQEDLADLHLNIKQKAAVRAAQDIKRRRLNDGGYLLGGQLLPSSLLAYLCPICCGLPLGKHCCGLTLAASCGVLVKVSVLMESSSCTPMELSCWESSGDRAAEAEKVPRAGILYLDRTAVILYSI